MFYLNTEEFLSYLHLCFTSFRRTDLTRKTVNSTIWWTGKKTSQNIVFLYVCYNITYCSTMLYQFPWFRYSMYNKKLFSQFSPTETTFVQHRAEGELPFTPWPLPSPSNTVRMSATWPTIIPTHILLWWYFFSYNNPVYLLWSEFKLNVFVECL